MYVYVYVYVYMFSRLSLHRIPFDEVSAYKLPLILLHQNACGNTRNLGVKPSTCRRHAIDSSEIQPRRELRFWFFWPVLEPLWYLCGVHDMPNIQRNNLQLSMEAQRRLPWKWAMSLVTRLLQRCGRVESQWSDLKGCSVCKGWVGFTAEIPGVGQGMRFRNPSQRIGGCDKQHMIAVNAISHCWLICIATLKW